MGETQGLEVRVRRERPFAFDAAFTCGPDEVLAIVGPSGSGKSTLLRCVAGLVTPRAGRVACGGEIWFDAASRIDLAPHRRRVGFVFQSYALFPHRTALGNVSMSLGDVPTAERDARARGLLAKMQLAGLEGRRPAELSGGEQQRVALARALAREPKVLLLDEPFAAVDRTTRRALYRELEALRRERSLPIVLVTHDLEEAGHLADRLCLLARGHVLQTGTLCELRARPASAEVAHLMDTEA